METLATEHTTLKKQLVTTTCVQVHIFFSLFALFVISTITIMVVDGIAVAVGVGVVVVVVVVACFRCIRRCYLLAAR